VTAVAVFTATALSAGPAAADVPPGVYGRVAGVGSPVSHPLLDALSTLTPEPQGSWRLISSYGPTGAARIKTKPVACEFDRPTSAAAGKLALRASEGEDVGAGPGSFDGDDVRGCVDYARATTYPLAQPMGTGSYTYIPVGVSAVTAAVHGSGDLPLGWSVPQMQRIYKCFDGAVAGVPATPRYLRPSRPGALPNPTWDHWLVRMSITQVEIDLGDYPCLAVDTDLDPFTVALPVFPLVEENDGTALAGRLGDVMPFAVEAYVAQGNAVTIAAATGIVVTDRRGPALLSGLRLTGGPMRQPTVNGAVNVDFPFKRDVYDVVPTRRLAEQEPYTAEAFVGPDAVGCTATVTVGGTPRSLTELFGLGRRTTRVGPLEAECGYTGLRADT